VVVVVDFFSDVGHDIPIEGAAVVGFAVCCALIFGCRKRLVVVRKIRCRVVTISEIEAVTFQSSQGFIHH